MAVMGATRKAAVTAGSQAGQERQVEEEEGEEEEEEEEEEEAIASSTVQDRRQVERWCGGMGGVSLCLEESYLGHASICPDQCVYDTRNVIIQHVYR